MIIKMYKIVKTESISLITYSVPIALDNKRKRIETIQMALIEVDCLISGDQVGDLL